jgi:hypothetical protein
MSMKSFGRCQARWAGENGQAAVLIAILCGMLILVIAATTNIGKITTEKIAMQNTVDLAAFSGAATQAGYMNKMREINNKIWQKEFDLRTEWKLSEAPYTDGDNFHAAQFDGFECPGASAGIMPALQGAEKQIIQFQAEIAMLHTDIDGVNSRANNAAKDAAKQAAQKNYPGTESHLQYYHSHDGKLFGLDKKTIEFSYKGYCIDEFGAPHVAQLVMQHDVDSWYWKQDPGQAIFAVGIVGAVPKSALLDTQAGYFPEDCKYNERKSGMRCSLDVFAVAEPFYGKLGSNLKSGQNDYEMDPTKVNTMPPTDIDDPGLLNAHKVYDGDFNDYRTRFIGIFDGDAAYAVKGGAIKQPIPFGDKMRH